MPRSDLDAMARQLVARAEIHLCADADQADAETAVLDAMRSHRQYAALRARAKGDEYEAHAKRCQGTRRITAEERALAFYRMADEEVENE